MRVRVQVPASTSNLGPGFDCLGLALSINTTLSVEPGGSGLRLQVRGRDASTLPEDARNLVCIGLLHAMGLSPEDPPALQLELESGIPVGRGLGSSGAAIVAGLIAGRLLTARPVVREELLAEATALEGHPDNVAPALLGGFVASAITTGRVHAVTLALPADLEFELVLPDRQSPTRAAREILPGTVPLAAAVHNLAHTAVLIGALARGEWNLLRPALHDRLHQEHRLRLLPGLAEALEALDAEPGCAGATLSGSGPALLGFVRAGHPPIGHRAAAVLARHGIACELMRVRPQTHGATWDLRLCHRDCS